MDYKKNEIVFNGAFETLGVLKEEFIFIGCSFYMKPVWF